MAPRSRTPALVGRRGPRRTRCLASSAAPAPANWLFCREAVGGARAWRRQRLRSTRRCLHRVPELPMSLRADASVEVPCPVDAYDLDRATLVP